MLESRNVDHGSPKQKASLSSTKFKERATQAGNPSPLLIGIIIHSFRGRIYTKVFFFL